MLNGWQAVTRTRRDLNVTDAILGHKIFNRASIRNGNKGSFFIRCHSMNIIFDVQLDLTDICVHFPLENGERAPVLCPLGTVLVPVMTYNVHTGHHMFVSAARTASSGALLNTCSEVFIGSTCHKCFLYLYLMFCKNHRLPLFHMVGRFRTHWHFQLFYCFCYHTPFICCSPCSNLHDVAIICISVRCVDSKSALMIKVSQSYMEDNNEIPADEILRRYGDTINFHLDNIIDPQKDDGEMILINPSSYDGIYCLPCCLVQIHGQLNILSINAQSLNAKYDELLLLLNIAHSQSIRLLSCHLYSRDLAERNVRFFYDGNRWLQFYPPRQAFRLQQPWRSQNICWKDCFLQKEAWVCVNNVFVIEDSKFNSCFCCCCCCGGWASDRGSRCANVNIAVESKGVLAQDNVV